MAPTDHTYPIKYKLRDCGMMKNFMASGPLTRGMKVNEVPDEGDTMPFPKGHAVMTIYDGRPSSGFDHLSNSSPGTPARCGLGCRNAGI
jgi:hypothetical protein